MKQSTIIQIPVPLHHQLKKLAKARNTTMVSIIADVIAQAVDRGEIEPETPGLELEVTRDTLTLRAGELTFPALTLTEANDLAVTLEDVAEYPKEVAIATESGVMFVRRRGAGVSLELDVKSDTRHVMAPVVARDLAAHIRHIVSKIKH